MSTLAVDETDAPPVAVPLSDELEDDGRKQGERVLIICLARECRHLRRAGGHDQRIHDRFFRRASHEDVDELLREWLMHGEKRSTKETTAVLVSDRSRVAKKTVVTDTVCAVTLNPTVIKNFRCVEMLNRQ